MKISSCPLGSLPNSKLSSDYIVQAQHELCGMALALCSLPAPGSLQQLVIIQRHGERERLFKHQNLSESGAALTAGGLKHISRVGVALRTRFLTPETCGSRCLLGELGRGRWAAHELHAESTGLARTLGTAEVMLRSLVPPDVRGELPIPVYSRPDADDFLLRGYAGGKCPMLTARINEFRASARFGAKEDATREYARHAPNPHPNPGPPRAARPVPLRSPAPALHPPCRQLSSASSTFSTSSTSSTRPPRLRVEVGRALPSDWAVPLVDGGAVRLRDMWNAYDALETAPSPLVTEETLARAEGAHPPLRCHPAPPLPPLPSAATPRLRCHPAPPLPPRASAATPRRTHPAPHRLSAAAPSHTHPTQHPLIHPPTQPGLEPAPAAPPCWTRAAPHRTVRCPPHRHSKKCPVAPPGLAPMYIYGGLIYTRPRGVAREPLLRRARRRRAVRRRAPGGGGAARGGRGAGAAALLLSPLPCDALPACRARSRRRRR